VCEKDERPNVKLRNEKTGAETRTWGPAENENVNRHRNPKRGTSHWGGKETVAEEGKSLHEVHFLDCGGRLRGRLATTIQVLISMRWKALQEEEEGIRKGGGSAKWVWEEGRGKEDGDQKWDHFGKKADETEGIFTKKRKIGRSRRGKEEQQNRLHCK